MVAVRAGVDLHHQPVVQAHAGHLGQHLGAEQLGLGRGDVPLQQVLEQGLGLDGRQVGGGGGGMAVVGGGGAGLDEGRPAQAVAFQIALPAGDVLARDLGEALEGAAKALVLEVDDRVGAIGGDHVAVPAALADGLVVLQPVLRALGGGQGLDVEAVEQGPGPERLGGQGFTLMRSK